MNISCHNVLCFFRALSNPHPISIHILLSFSSFLLSIFFWSLSFARKNIIKKISILTTILSPLSPRIFFPQLSKIKSTKHPLYHWLNARATRELNVAFPENFFFTPSLSTVFALSSQPFSLSFSRVRMRHISLSFSRSIHLSAKILVDFSRGLHPLPFHFPRTCHPRFSNPSLKPFHRLKSHSCAHPSRGSSLPRLRCSRRLPSDFPFAPSCLARETFFCPWQLYVAQQRPRKGPHFSSEGVSPRGNCAIATSAP